MIHPIEFPTFAIDWCHKLGASPDTLEPLAGGINNEVFRCESVGCRFVIKGYAAHRANEHDRFRAELEFLNYATAVAPEFVPQVLGSDETSRSLVLESIEGESFQEGTHPSPEDVQCAVIFMRCLNTDIDLAQQYVSGSAAEGFLRLSEHLQNIEQRVTKMSVKHLTASCRAKAKKVIECIRRELERLQQSTEFFITRGFCEDALNPRTRCVSPSDFGFHNAIRSSTGVKLFDFEFAGWDDPVKAVADFDLQPRVPLNVRTNVLRNALPVWGQDLAARYNVLAPILKLKWACIILGVLNPDRYARMTATANGQPSEQLIRRKIHLTYEYLKKD
ncbi:MAG: hypothetical protein EBZ48_09120 [Proteobacteria bacterium]|nr:hypothetical protein [Pseudomonadota bacterium]